MHRLAVLFIPLVLLFPSTTLAKAELSFSPVSIKLEGKPGETITRTISLTSTGSDPLVASYSHVDVGFDSKTYAPQLIEDDAPETTSFSTRGWFSVDPAKIRINAGETKRVTLKVKIPNNAETNTHIGMALFSFSGISTKEPGQITTVTRTGPIVFVDVKGGTKPKLSVEKFRLSKIIFGKAIRPEIQVENHGEMFASVSGVFTMTRKKHKISSEIGEQIVLPSKPRSINTAAGGDRIEIAPHKLTFGRHNAQLKLTVSPSGQKLIVNQAIWLLPGWLKPVIAVLVLFVVGGILSGVSICQRRRVLSSLPQEEEVEDEEYDSNEW